MESLVVQIKGVSKGFPGVKALDQVSFDVEAGEIHAIVGENGAGKSTLMNILSGVYRPDSGQIFFNGQEEQFIDPRDAQDKGIAMIHQELSLATNLNVMENIYLGRMQQNRFGFIQYSKMYELCRKELRDAGVHTISPTDMVETLSLSQMQMIEIVKALSLKAKLIIMDEPTASLTQNEANTLMKIIKSLKSQGVSILYISHKMDEIFELTDRITVLRDGVYVQTLRTQDTTQEEIISLMVGRTFNKDFQREQTGRVGEQPILEVKAFSVAQKVKSASFELRRGEIVAFTGLVGAGRTELVQGIFGLEKDVSGQIFMSGQEVKISSPAQAIKLGLGLVPEGRKSQGLLMGMSVKENITISKINLKNMKLFLNKKQEAIDTHKYVQDLAIKTPHIDQEVQFLSGGNQQKCIFSRWLLNNPKILILDEPTHGVDVGAKAEIYKVINQLAKEGMAIILISSELPEVLSLADRIYVMKEGRITKEFLIDEANQENIMHFATVS